VVVYIHAAWRAAKCRNELYFLYCSKNICIITEVIKEIFCRHIIWSVTHRCFYCGTTSYDVLRRAVMCFEFRIVVKNVCLFIRDARHVMWRQRILFVTSIIRLILFTTIRNTKLVTAHRGTSQLVILHKCRHSRFKSCNMTTKISTPTSVIQHIFFKTIQNSKFITVRRSSSCRTI
jgi:hypothetical protein